MEMEKQITAQIGPGWKRENHPYELTTPNTKNPSSTAIVSSDNVQEMVG